MSSLDFEISYQPVFSNDISHSNSYYSISSICPAPSTLEDTKKQTAINGLANGVLQKSSDDSQKSLDSDHDITQVNTFEDQDENREITEESVNNAIKLATKLFNEYSKLQIDEQAFDSKGPCQVTQLSDLISRTFHRKKSDFAKVKSNWNDIIASVCLTAFDRQTISDAKALTIDIQSEKVKENANEFFKFLEEFLDEINRESTSDASDSDEGIIETEERKQTQSPQKKSISTTSTTEEKIRFAIDLFTDYQNNFVHNRAAFKIRSYNKSDCKKIEKLSDLSKDLDRVYEDLLSFDRFRTVRKSNLRSIVQAISVKCYGTKSIKIIFNYPCKYKCTQRDKNLLEYLYNCILELKKTSRFKDLNEVIDYLKKI